MKRIFATLAVVALVVSNTVSASETTGTIGTGGGLEGNSGLSGTVCPSSASAAKPTGLVASPVSTSTIDISWSAASGATTYRLYRATDAGFTADVTKIYEGSTPSYTHSSLPAATRHYYKVNAVYSTCSTSVESSFATTAVSARTDAPAVAISNSQSGAVVTQELIDGGFTASGSTLVGSTPITLAASGTLVVPVQFVSTNSITN